MLSDTTRSKKFWAALRQSLKSFGKEYASYVSEQTGIPRNAVAQFCLERVKTLGESSLEALDKAGLLPREIKVLADAPDEPELRKVASIPIAQLVEHPENKQLLPPLCASDEAELLASLQNEIKPIPFEVLANHNRYIVLDGNNRLRLLKEKVGYKGELPCLVLGDAEEWPADKQRTTIQRINLARRHLTADEKKEIARQMVARGESVRDVAKVVGLSKSTVAESAREVIEARQEAVKEAVGELKAVGVSHAAIAKEVGISEKTVSRTTGQMSEIGQMSEPEPEPEEKPIAPKRTEAEKAEVVAKAKAKLEEKAVLARAAGKEKPAKKEKPVKVTNTASDLAAAWKRIEELEAENAKLKEDNSRLRARVAELEIAQGVLEDEIETEEPDIEESEVAAVTMSVEDLDEIEAPEYAAAREDAAGEEE